MSIAEQALSMSVAAGVPVLLWGSPGTGKTAVVRALGDVPQGCPQSCPQPVHNRATMG